MKKYEPYQCPHCKTWMCGELKPEPVGCCLYCGHSVDFKKSNDKRKFPHNISVIRGKIRCKKCFGLNERKLDGKTYCQKCGSLKK